MTLGKSNENMQLIYIIGCLGVITMHFHNTSNQKEKKEGLVLSHEMGSVVNSCRCWAVISVVLKVMSGTPCVVHDIYC